MTFAPRYIPYREAARIVAERCGLKEGRFNPLDAALSESLILPEVIVRERPGQWRQIKPGEWDRLEIIRDAYPNPNKGFSVVEGDDHVRVLMAEIDRLWPPATAQITDLAASPDDEDMRLSECRLKRSSTLRALASGRRRKKTLNNIFWVAPCQTARELRRAWPRRWRRYLVRRER